MNGKLAAGRAAAALVRDGMRLGLGTGSTAECFLEALGQRIRSERLRVGGVPTSDRTAALAEKHGIPLLSFAAVTALDLTVDGADEIAPDLSLIKGGGGALLREKIVAWAAREMVVIATPDKLVSELGTSFALPLEILPFAAPLLLARLQERQLAGTLRTKDGRPFTTDNGNYVIDVKTGPIRDARSLNASLRSMPGVLETGLFMGLATRALIGHEDHRVETRLP